MSRNLISVVFHFVPYLLTSLVIMCSSINAHAIVSMENVHLGNPPEGFTGSFALDLALDGGNTETAGAATGVKLQWTREQITDFILANYEYGETAGVANKNKGFAHYRHIQQLDSQFAWEGFAQLSGNEFTNLTLRALAGGGVRLKLGENSDTRALFIGLGGFFEREKINTKYLEEADAENAVRGNAYLVIKYLFNEHVTLVSTTYYQPNLGDPPDYRAIEDFSLVSKLNDVLAINLRVFVAYDSEPPRDIKQTDSSIKIGIVVSF
jgi:putative salt-induced outer membrane protein YdiY